MTSIENTLCIKAWVGSELRRIRLPNACTYDLLEQKIAEFFMLPEPTMLFIRDSLGAHIRLHPQDVPQKLHEPSCNSLYAHVVAVAMPRSPSPSRSIILQSSTSTPVSPADTNTNSNSSVSLSLVSHDTIPEDTRVAPGARFTKRWLLEGDIGATKTDVALRCVWGPRLGFTDDVVLSLGSTNCSSNGDGSSGSLAIECTLQAPLEPGKYRSLFKCFDCEGNDLSGVLSCAIVVDAEETGSSMEELFASTEDDGVVLHPMVAVGQALLVMHDVTDVEGQSYCFVNTSLHQSSEQL